MTHFIYFSISFSELKDLKFYHIFIFQEGLTDDDYDMFYEIWQQFDPNGTQYIKYGQLSDFLDVLESPLQIHKPNKYKIISMDIPICRGDLCYCVDVLDALTKDFFARKGNPVEETAELGEVTAQADRPGYDPISSTLWRQREEYCARMIQTVWRRNYKHDEAGADLTRGLLTLPNPLALLHRGMTTGNGDSGGVNGNGNGTYQSHVTGQQSAL